MIGRDKITIFDFCGTLVSEQTGDAFLIKILEENKRSFLVKIIKISDPITYRIAKILNIPTLRKKILLFLTFGLRMQKIQDIAEVYGHDLYENYKFSKVVKKVHWYRENGYENIIISAGFDLYIRTFAEKIQITKVYAGRIKQYRGRSVGILQDKDLYGEEKRDFLQRIISNKTLRTVAFGDSESDKFIMAACDEAYKVSISGDIANV